MTGDGTKCVPFPPNMSGCDKKLNSASQLYFIYAQSAVLIILWLYPLQQSKTPTPSQEKKKQVFWIWY